MARRVSLSLSMAAIAGGITAVAVSETTHNDALAIFATLGACAITFAIFRPIERLIEEASDAAVNKVASKIGDSYHSRHNGSTTTRTSDFHSLNQRTGTGGATGISSNYQNRVDSVARVKSNAGPINSNEWRCICGHANPNYTGTCSCGMRKSEAINETKRRNETTKELIRQKAAAEKKYTTNNTSQASSTSTDISFEQEKVKLLKEYKELFDSGVISEEEFNAKKASILKD